MSLKIEGFRLDRLLTECLAKGINLKDVRSRSDIEMTFNVTYGDYEKLVKIVQSKYRITILNERGSRPLIKRALVNKISLVGAALFCFLIYYQSLFVSEIRIYGYEAVPETQIRQVLRDAGFYEGCRKDIDVENVKQAVYTNIEDVIWIGISARGSMAEVNIVEGGMRPPPVIEDDTPCHIVAERPGYIAEIIPRNGLRTVEDGAYVNAGDILITGIIPLSRTVYGTDPDAPAEMYVHADGNVKAKVPYYAKFYQERYERSLVKTGKLLYGIEIRFGDKRIDTLRFYNNYEVSRRTSGTIFNTLRPLPIKITLLKAEEVKLLERERSNEEIEKRAEEQLRIYNRENLPKDAQILNKSLKFSTRENIIEVSILFDALMEIGKKQEITFGEI